MIHNNIRLILPNGEITKTKYNIDILEENNE